MSAEQFTAFLEKVKSDNSLQGRLGAAADVDAVLAIAKEAGFMLTADDFKNTPSELSDEELAGVAGGCGMSAINGWTALGAVMQEGVDGVGGIFGSAVWGIEKMTGKDII